MLKRILSIQILVVLLFCGVVSGQNKTATPPAENQDATVDTKPVEKPADSGENIADTIYQIREKILDLKTDELDRNYTIITIIFAVITLMLVSIGFITYTTTKNAKIQADKEIDEIKRYKEEIKKMRDEVAGLLKIAEQGAFKAKEFSLAAENNFRNMAKYSNPFEPEPISQQDSESQLNKELTDSKLTHSNKKAENVPKILIDFIRSKSSEEISVNYERIIEESKTDSALLTASTPQIHKIAGSAYYKLMDYRKSLLAYSRYLKLFPKDSESLSYTGFSHMMLESHDKAIYFFRKSIENNKNNLNELNKYSYYNWGRSLLRLFMFRPDESYLHDAIDKFKESILLDSNHGDTLNNLGLTYQMLYLLSKKTELLDLAIREFKSALGKVTDKSSIYYNLARAYSLKKNISSVIENLKLAIDLDDKYKNDAINDILFETYKESDEEFRKLVGLDEDDSKDNDTKS